MSKRLISFALAILFAAGLIAAFPTIASASSGDGSLRDNISIDFRNETIRFATADPNRSFIMFALNSAPQTPSTSAEQRLLSRERWQVANVVAGAAEVDISRVIPRAGRVYNVAFMIPGQPGTRTVMPVPARPANRSPASGIPEINVGRPRNGVGIAFEFCDDYSYIVNRSGVAVVIQFGPSARPASFANTEFRLASETATPSSLAAETTITIPTHQLARTLQFTAHIDATASAFASQPVRLTIPAQPRAPAIRQFFVRNDSTGGTLNFRNGHEVQATGEIRTGFPQVRRNGADDWTELRNLPGTGSRTPLWLVLRELRDDGVAITALDENAPESARTIFIRYGHSSRAGASAVQRLVVRDITTWNNAVRLMNDNTPIRCLDCNRAPCGSPCANGLCDNDCCVECNPPPVFCPYCGNLEGQCVDCTAGTCDRACCLRCNPCDICEEYPCTC